MVRDSGTSFYWKNDMETSINRPAEIVRKKERGGNEQNRRAHVRSAQMHHRTGETGGSQGKQHQWKGVESL